MHTKQAVTLFALSLIPSALSYCPPPGALLPPPSLKNSTSGSPVSESALKELEGDDTSFAIRATIGDKDVFSYGYLAPAYDHNNIGLYDTKFRVGSVTKVLTVLAVLLSEDKILFSDSIKKFVPELSGDVWDDVTIQSLADQTSGLGRFGFVGDLAVIPTFDPASVGIGPQNNTHPGCDPFPGGKTCSYEQVIDMFNNPSQLPHSPNSGPLYSNIGFNLLGMALEKVHGKTFEEVVQDLILSPLELSQSTFIPPNDTSRAILPQPGDRWFVPNFENYNPTGGLWSTPNEFHKIFRAIANNEFLSAPATRKWLQPRAILPSLTQLVGAPWEILRPADLKVKFPRPIDIYTKSGGVDGYAGYGIIVPEYNLAVTLNAGGNSSTKVIQSAMATVLQGLIEYADVQAREQATARYAGTYKDSTGNSSMTFEVDDGPGVAITEFTMNGVKVLNTIAAIQKKDPANFSARVYPTDTDSLGTEKEFWWMHFDTIKKEESFADMLCSAWFQLDLYRYNRESLDAVKFVTEGGNVVAVEMTGWRMALQKS
ncbi:beta-lactamase/transpeptidase-like protein [Aaosphaeria arxii CBS 175.79]|uniref:Beta-lactamase/transpeptidase-like protein n=1 Tax=Aaosphaeria arxii CBS 175.79 TaxID=1450172 RepID=A0A6A5XWZ6_9PLEO|nr:beta-lactamase/transpeptidase-like protein [Aaosphaeria arxii CBS 175.79]KAF2017479.1 beta-lactamase/transpeptidase-like protein [Aaosphaeria arxii CBS 175.79]